jgi:hypothetical protein
MTMQCSKSPRSLSQGPKAPAGRFSLVAGALFGAVLLTACNGASVMEMSPPGPDDMKPMGMNPGNTMSGSMNGAGGTSSGMATLKFCNAVSKQSGSVELELVIGSLRLKAPSGSCAPTSGCSTVPSGKAHLVFNMDGKEVFAQDIAIDGGSEYVVISTVDQGSQKVGLGGGKLKSGATCAKENPFPNGSSPGGGPVATAGKFCHSLSVNDGMPVTLTLIVGDVSMSALSRGCSTDLGRMCLGLKAGATKATLMLGDQEVTSKDITIDDGKEYLFTLGLNGGTPVIQSQALPAGNTCANTGPSGGGAQPPGGTTPPPAGMAEFKLCNKLPAMANGNVVELAVGDVTLTAKPGTCSPMKGAPCSKAPTGATVITIAIDGQELGSANANLPAAAFTFDVSEDPTTGDLSIDPTEVPSGMTCSNFESP